MTVNNTKPIAGPYIADGINRDWAFGFKITAASQIVITLETADGLQTTVTGGYSVPGSSIDSDSDNTVTYPSDPTMFVPAGTIVYVGRHVDIGQPVKIGNLGNFYPENHERALDNLALQIADLAQEVFRSIKSPVGQSGEELGAGVIASVFVAAQQVLTARDATFVARDVTFVARDQAVAAAEASGSVKFFNTKAEATAALGTLTDQQIVGVWFDETSGGGETRYRVETGALVLKVVLVASKVDMRAGTSGARASALGVRQAIEFDFGRAPLLDAFYETSDGADWGLTMVRAAAAATVIRLVPGATYNFYTQALIARGVTIQGNGATFKSFGNFTPVVVDIPWLRETTISAITTADVDLSGSGTNASGTTPVSVLNVADPTGYAANQLIKVAGDDLIAWQDPADKERQGEFATVSSVVGNLVYLRSRLVYTYTTARRCAIVDTSQRVDVRGVKIEFAAGWLAAWRPVGLMVVGAFAPVIEDIRTDLGLASLVQLDGCFNARTRNIVARNLRTDSNPGIGAFGYALLCTSCEGGVHIGLYGENVRHVYTTGVRQQEAGQDIRRCGSCRHERVSLSIAFNCQHTGFDTHGDAEHCHFSDCIAFMEFNGPNGSRQGFATRGHDNTFSNCVAFGGHGFYAFTSYGVPGNSGNHVFEDCKHYPNPAFSEGSRYSFWAAGRVGVSAGPDSIVDNVVFRNCSTIRPSGGAAIVYSERSKVFVEAGSFKAALDTTTQGALEVGVSGDILVRKASFDLSGSVGTNQSFCKAIIAGGKIIVEDSYLKGAADIDMGCNFGGAVATCHIRELRTDAPLALPAAGSNGIFSLDYVAEGDLTSSYAYVTPATYSTTADKTLALGARAAKTVYASFNVTASGEVKLVEISAGMRVGQEAVLSSSWQSTQNLRIPANTGRFKFPADVLLTPGLAVRAFWDGSFWRRAS